MATKLKKWFMRTKLNVASDLSIPTVDIVAKLREKDLSEVQTLESKSKDQMVIPAFKLGALPSLDLSGCSEFKELPTSIDKLIALQFLHLSWCLKLTELPTSIDKLTCLEKLDLLGCSKLKELPTSIDKLTALQWLHLSGCSQLKELPISIDKLTTLR
jgi:Leucine-rich repeat (LRR) protein